MKKLQSITKEDLLELDFDRYKNYTKNLPADYQWLYGDPGQEHYRLLAYLSTQYPAGTVFADIGTYRGFSALALAYNSKCRVITYDIEMVSFADLRKYPNIDFRTQNCMDAIEDIVNVPLIFLDIDPHDGVQEEQFLQLLVEHNYKGLVICDDTTSPMAGTSSWFSSVIDRGFETVDLSHIGHKTGTGAIIFS